MIDPTGEVAPLIILGAIIAGAAYAGGYLLWEETDFTNMTLSGKDTGRWAILAVGFLAGYSAVEHHIDTWYDPCASVWDKTTAASNAVFNATFGIASISGVGAVGKIGSRLSTIGGLSNTNRMASLVSNGEEVTVLVLSRKDMLARFGADFWREMGTRKVYISEEVLKNKLRGVSILEHEMTHIAQEFGQYKGLIMDFNLKMSAWTTQTLQKIGSTLGIKGFGQLSAFTPTYTVNIAEVTAASQGPLGLGNLALLATNAGWRYLITEEVVQGE